MPYQTDLEEALRDWGLSDYLHLVNGHRTRGSSSFNPRGSTNHHTAGSTNGSIPSLNVLINGHGTLPGPLCNVGQSRSSNFNPRAKYDDVYLIACGRANHAGRGGFRGLVGNSSVFGLEIEHCGYLDREGFSERRQHTAWRVHCAFMEAGGFNSNMVHQHEEWAPTRKIDFVDANFTGFRNGVEATRLSSLWTPSQEQDSGDDEMWETFIVWSYNDARGNGNQASPSYDVRLKDPGGFKTWMISVAKQKNSSDRMDVINFLRYSLSKETGKSLPLY